MTSHQINGARDGFVTDVVEAEDLDSALFAALVLVRDDGCDEATVTDSKSRHVGGCHTDPTVPSGIRVWTIQGQGAAA